MFEIVESIHAAQSGINADYTMSQLETFIKRQSLRALGADFVKAIQKDTEEGLSEAEELIAKVGHIQLSVFDPGTRLSDTNRVLRFLDTQQSSFPTGVPELDRRGLGPTRKELWLGIANAKAGKSWMLIQLAKMALLHRIKVCHITLEMSEERTSQRYLQTLFAIAKRDERFRQTKLQLDNLGRISGFDDVVVRPKLSFDDPNIRTKLERKIERFSGRLLDNIVIKQFPTGALTVPQLNAYLDNLEATKRFTPDLLIVDYPDLMEVDVGNYRLALDKIYKDLRGLMIKRNVAGAIVSQSHRAAATSKQVRADNIAEAYSKIAHVDTIVTYTQTKAEKALGLARLFVAGGRNDEDKFTIVITQNYNLGNFVIDSAMMRGAYWQLLPKDIDDPDA